jgi:hypothetical protein
MDGDLVADALGFLCTDAGFAAPAAETVDVYLDAFVTEGTLGTMAWRPGWMAMTSRIVLLSASRTWRLVLSLSGSSSESFLSTLAFRLHTQMCDTVFIIHSPSLLVRCVHAGFLNSRAFVLHPSLHSQVQASYCYNSPSQHLHYLISSTDRIWRLSKQRMMEDCGAALFQISRQGVVFEEGGLPT